MGEKLQSYPALTVVLVKKNMFQVRLGSCCSSPPEQTGGWSCALLCSRHTKSSNVFWIANHLRASCSRPLPFFWFRVGGGRRDAAPCPRVSLQHPALPGRAGYASYLCASTCFCGDLAAEFTAGSDERPSSSVAFPFCC